MCRRGCWMTRGSRRTGSIRRGSSASTPGRWGRSVTVSSASRCTPSARAARCRWGGRCICQRIGVMIPSVARRRRSRSRCSSAPSPSRAWISSSGRRAGVLRSRRRWAMRPTAITPRCASVCNRPYVLAIGAETTVYAPETTFAVPPRTSNKGRPPTRARADREPEAIKDLIARLGQQTAETLTFRDGPDGEPITSQFIFVRVRAAHDVPGQTGAPREEWLIAEWPTGASEPLDYWISNLPTDAPHQYMATLARLRWKIELDYRELKGQLGLAHYEGRSYLGWYHHTALVTAAHGFLTLERQHPNHPRPA